VRARLGTVAGLLMVIAASACGSGSGPVASPSPSGTAGTSATPSGSPTPTAPSSTPASGSGLTIVVDDGTGSATTWTLTCEPVGGTHPDPEGACTALTDHLSALNPVPKDKMCAQVYSGPERATISGTWQDEQVFATLSRVNSCETARWDALVPLLPAGGR
jgi:Subtilisin inhibitor-like